MKKKCLNRYRFWEQIVSIGRKEKKKEDEYNAYTHKKSNWLMNGVEVEKQHYFRLQEK